MVSKYSEVADSNKPERYQPVELESTDKNPLGVADLKDVKGQSHARRALEIAAAGGHNLILSDRLVVVRRC